MAQRQGKFVMSTALLAMAISRAFAAEATPPTLLAQGNTEQPRSAASLTVSIPAQRLADSLRQLAEVSGLQLVYDAKIVEGKTAPGVTGTMTAQAALTTLLAGSGLNFRFSGDRTVLLGAAGAGGVPGVRAIGVVSVNGVKGVGGPMPYRDAMTAVNGVNGSRDVETTEGTGSYTTGAVSMGSKIPMPMKDIPQSVSVMSLQQIQDQNLISARDILTQLAGVTVANGGGDQDFQIFSRGFEVRSYSFDGGATYNSSFYGGSTPVLNMSEFDSVQLLRGSDGLFGGYGDPGGTLNLVRKKPLDHNQFSYEQNIGSYSNFREVLDLTGPLTADRSLRGRVVVSNQDNHFYYKVAQAHKKSVYGILEYDLTSKTLLTVGASMTQEHNLPNTFGLPRYYDGGAIDWPTSTCLCAKFSSEKVRRGEAFFKLAHDFNEDWSANLNYTYAAINRDELNFGVQSLIYKDSPVAIFSGTGYRIPEKQSELDVTTTGKFRLLGHEHSIVVGANTQYIDAAGGRNSATYPEVTIPDVYHFNPNDYTRPADPGISYNNLKSNTLLLGLYGNLRVEPIDDLHLSVGMRYNSYRQKGIFGYAGQANEELMTTHDRSHSKPNFGMTYDFLKNFTLYGSYQYVSQPQLNAHYVISSTPPPPITGVNEELGLKWQSTDKKLNASVATYNITQNDFLLPDYSTYTNGFYTAYTKDSQNFRSKGVDLEVTGEIAPRLQLSANYSYNLNKTVTSFATSTTLAYQPRNLLKTWLTYRGAGDGRLGRLLIGGGVNVQSNAYNAGYVCTTLDADKNCSAYSPYSFSTPGYATVSAKLGYNLSKNFDAAIKFDNIANIKRIGASKYQNVAAYNFYVTPFNVMATLTATWQ